MLNWFTLWAHFSYFVSDFWGYLVALSASFLLFFFFSFQMYKSNNLSETQKQALIGGLFTILSFIVIYSGCEAYFRYRYDQSDGLGFLKTYERWMQRHVVFNNYQYRDRNFSIQKSPDVTRIGVYGDSLTLGQGIKDVNNRFSNLLEKKLRDKGYHVEVYNMGVSGLDTCGFMQEYNRTKQLNFDIIVWEYFVNDAEPCKHSQGTQVLEKNFIRNPIVTWLSNHSFFFDFMYWRLTPIYQKTFVQLRFVDLQQYHIPSVLKQHEEDVTAVSQAFHGPNGNRPVITIMFPSLVLLGPNYPGKDSDQLMQDYFKQQGNIVIDMLPLLIKKDKKQLMVNIFDSHPNEYVNSLAADQLYAKIVPLLKK